jgi:type 1 glutamine amidotransferase
MMLNNRTISKVIGSKWLVMSLAALVLLTPAPARAAQQAKPLRVLIFNGLHNHNWAATTPVLKKIFEGCDRFGVVDVTGDPAKMDATTFAQYDVIVNNWTPYPETKRTWPPETEKASLDYIEGGGGFVVFHASSCSFQVWPEFQKLVALTWKADYTAHGAYHPFKVTIEAPNHPIARGLTDFYTTDELYHNMVQMVEQPLNVVFKAFSAKEQGGTGKFEPMLVWTKMGKGRGVNLVLGHDVAAMQTGFRTLMLRSAEWAATGEVTIPPPANWRSTLVAMKALAIDIDATLKAVAGYQYGDERKPLSDLQQLVIYANSVIYVPTAANVRKELAEKIVATLAAPNTTSPAKEFLCQQIAVIGAEDQAPALAALLADKDLSQMARCALEHIPGPAVDRAQRDALPRFDGAVKIGIVNTLGEWRDAQAVGDLIPLLGDSDAGLAGAAADALGKIGGDESAGALKNARSRTSGAVRVCVDHAYLMCAEQWLAQGRKSSAAKIYAQLAEPGEAPPTRMAALRGLVATDGQNGMAALTRALAGNDPALQSMAIQLVPELADKNGHRNLCQITPANIRTDAGVAA